MKNFPKVTADMFWMQMLWTFGFLGVMFIINIIKIVIDLIQGTEVDGYYASVLIASNIYMVIIGLISIYFLPYYVGNGVTRKDYFKGGLLASFGLSLAIPIITFFISIVERFIVTNLLNLNFHVIDINEAVLDVDGNIIGDLVLSVILTPYVDPGSNWLLAMGVFSLHLFIFYLLGWFISASFYRFGTLTGLVFILIAFIIILLKDLFLRISLGLPLSDRFSSLASLPLGVTLPGIMLLIVFTVWGIRLLTKRVTIKM
ncbi:hypothetical protein [Oceanobacillus sp. Castelsardo]|uniref:hypothetical protein n=1 Tax=Oceanobacillus sp. Castelsardo TaxID=1851204 RepID=UPI000838051F|nr:hypothetical protein [Oceanobacillus sp. Castelsardo]